MKYAILDSTGATIATIVADAASVELIYPGRYRIINEVVSAPVDRAQWWIDEGPFFDRFGSAKMSILTNQNNPVVLALLRDIQSRKWVDLTRPDVAAGIDAMIAQNIPGVTAAVKTAVLTTPVTRAENEWVRKLFLT